MLSSYLALTNIFKYVHTCTDRKKSETIRDDVNRGKSGRVQGIAFGQGIHVLDRQTATLRCAHCGLTMRGG